MGAEELMAFSKARMKVDEERKPVTVLTDAIEDFFLGLNEDQQYNEETYGGEIERGFHPSSLAGVKCARKLQYEWLGVPVDDRMDEGISPKLRRIFDNGSDLHDRWQRYFTLLSQKNPDIQLVGSWRCKGCGYVHGADKEVEYPLVESAESQKPIPMSCPTCGSRRWKYAEFRLRHEDLRLTGKRDLKLLVKGEPYLGEIKSMNTFQFAKLHAGTIDHKKQFSLYMLMDGTKKGFFLYEDKNTQDYKLFLYEYDSSVISSEVAVLQVANRGIDEKMLCPQVSDFPNGKNCKLCGYYRTCGSGQSYEEIEKILSKE